MTCSELAKSFATAILPAELKTADTVQFHALGREIKARSGEAIGSNENSDQLIFVARGATKLVAHASAGREQVVAFHFAGDLVSVPASGVHAYSLVALSDCELLAFPAKAFFNLARREPAVMGAILDRAMTALGRSREKSIALGRKSAQERIASFLVSMADRIGSFQDDCCALDLPMSRRDIADSLGLTIETVSRQFSELRDLGLLQTSGRSAVRLPDLSSLQDLSGHTQIAA